MRIVAINSSYRGEHGFTQVLLDQIKKGAMEAGAEFETVILANHQINRCLGCNVCHTEENYLKCVFEDQDDVQAIFQKIREADLIIYATPIYIFNLSGLIKIFFERFNSAGDINKLQVSKKGLIFHHFDKSLCAKPFVVLTTCNNIEAETPKSVITYFKTFAKFTDAPMVGALVRKAGFLFQNKTERESPRKNMVFKAFQAAGRDLALTGKISKKHQRRASRNVMQLPPLINLIAKIRPLRAIIIAEGQKRNAIHFK